MSFGALTLRETLAFGFGGLVALAAFNSGVAQARMVPSGSMTPTFEVGDRLLVVPHTGPIKRGQVLVFRPLFHGLPGTSQAPGFFAELSEEAPYVKRCVAISGDEVEMRKGEGLCVNGRLLHEPYLAELPNYAWGPLTVPEGQLCVLGDNRNNSFDSHYWGFLPAQRVTGRPAAVIWPPRRWRRI